VFTGNQYQSWLDNKIIENLSVNYELEIVILNSREYFEGVLNFYYDKNLNSIKSLYLINQINNLRLSKSFSFRLRRMYLGSINFSGENLTITDKIRGFFLILRNLAGYSRKNFIQILAFVDLVRKFLEIYYHKKFKLQLLKVQNSKINFLKEIVSDIVIFPTSGAELLAFELLELCKLEKKKSLFVIENWDNLTSKTTFPCTPDFITVMGDISAIQAQKIHGFSKSSIAVTGLPRFEKFSEKSEGFSLGKPKNDSIKILYLGFSLPYNEILILKTLVLHLQKNYFPSEFEIHYKPHPLRQKRFKEDTIQFEDVCKKSLITVWEEKSVNGKNLPLINDDYLSFLRNFDIVITTPTTMSLEVMMLDIPCVIDSGDDGIHITSPWHSMDSYLHLEDLFSITELRIARNGFEICTHLDELMKSKSALQHYSINHIVEFREKFSTNLVKFLKNIGYE
jgi:hypothetical protein